VSVDLLFASSGVETEPVDDSERQEIASGIQLPVASVGYLIALKLLSEDIERPTDRADLRSLAGVATAGDSETCTRAVALIAERGFYRDRNLARALRALRSS
jgi:hypothetical protein